MNARAVFPLLFLVAGCPGRGPLPEGPPPEYEPARGYESPTNIDEPAQPGDDGLDALLADPPTEAKPPETPPSPDAPSAQPAIDGGAGGSLPDGGAPSP